MTMKLMKVILLLISVIWTVFNFIKVISSPDVVNLTNFIAIVPIVTGLYSEIDWIYVNWNKLRAYFLLKTVSFIPKSSKNINVRVKIQDIDSKIRQVLKENSYEIIESAFKSSHENLEYDIVSKNGIKSKINFDCSAKDIDRSLIVLKQDFQVSYRDVKKEWKEFLILRDELFSFFPKNDGDDERYDVSIITDKSKQYNPFYRLTIRHIGKKKIEKFELKFTDDDLSIKTNLNKIYGTSKKRDSIEKLILEYVPLSRTL